MTITTRYTFQNKRLTRESIRSSITDNNYYVHKIVIYLIVMCWLAG